MNEYKMATCPNCEERIFDLNDHYHESASGMGHYRCQQKKKVKVYNPDECPKCGKKIKDPDEHYYESGSGMGHYHC